MKDVDLSRLRVNDSYLLRTSRVCYPNVKHTSRILLISYTIYVQDWNSSNVKKILHTDLPFLYLFIGILFHSVVSIFC